jgi:predicted glycosyltransferase
MRTLVYCHHSLGIGHLMRSLRIAQSLHEESPVEMICGGPVPEQIQRTTRIRLHRLPILDFSLARSDVLPADKVQKKRVKQQREQQVEQIVRSFKPDVLIIEMFPFGRKKLAGEIVAMINTARQCGAVRVFCSVRDVLVTTRSDQQVFDQRAAKYLNQYFDVLLIHSDPDLIKLDRSFSAMDAIRIPVAYTGYIAPPGPDFSASRHQRVVVSAGGGLVGGKLLEVAARTAPRLRSELGLATTIISGPLARIPESASPSGNNVSYTPFVKNLAQFLAESSLSISQCGYNTATDILAARVPAVFVPFETSSENEQRMRAGILSDLGRSVLLRETSLNIETLVSAAKAACESSHDVAGAPVNINTQGIRNTCKLIKEHTASAIV